LFFEPRAFYVIDRGYMDFKRMDLIAQAAALFVTRAKDNLQIARQVSQPVDYPSGVRSDQIGKPRLPKARADSLRSCARFVTTTRKPGATWSS
jgi:hypothetical protein